MLTNLDIDKVIKEKDDSFNQLNLDEDLPTRNRLSTLAPKKNDIEMCDVSTNPSVILQTEQKLIQLMVFYYRK